jgi:hypothetical protein
MNNRFTLRRLRAWATIAALSLPGAASAFDWKDGFDLQSRPGDRYGLMYSPYTAHFHPSPDHKYVWLVGVEREREDAQLAGITLFSNSFGQPTTYIFPWGKIYRDVFEQRGLFVKLTAGLLYGYRGKYEDKVPFNYDGFSPAIVPALGWEYGGRFQAQVNLLGANAVMLQFTLGLR